MRVNSLPVIARNSFLLDTRDFIQVLSINSECQLATFLSSSSSSTSSTKASFLSPLILPLRLLPPNDPSRKDDTNRVASSFALTHTHRKKKMIGKKILAFVALSGLVASTLAAPAALEKRSDSYIVDLRYESWVQQVGKEDEGHGIITATTTDNGKTIYSNTQNIQFQQQFPSKTCFDGHNYCVQITTTDNTCNFYFWDRNQQFSYNPVRAQVSGNPDQGDYHFICEMNWKASS